MFCIKTKPQYSFPQLCPLKVIASSYIERMVVVIMILLVAQVLYQNLTQTEDPKQGPANRYHMLGQSEASARVSEEGGRGSGGDVNCIKQ